MKNKLIILLGVVLIVAGIGLSIENRFATNVADTNHNNRVKGKQEQSINTSEKETNKNTHSDVDKNTNKAVDKTTNNNVDKNVNNSVDNSSAVSSCYGDYKLEGARSYIAALIIPGDANLTISKDSLKLIDANSNIIFEKSNPEFSGKNINATDFANIYGESAKMFGGTENNMTAFTLKNSGESSFEFTQINSQSIVVSYNGSPYLFSKITNNNKK